MLVYRITIDGRNVGLAKLVGRHEVASDLRLSPLDTARIKRWVESVLSGSNRITRCYYHDGVSEWGMEQVPASAWTKAEPILAGPPKPKPEPRREPEPERPAGKPQSGPGVYRVRYENKSGPQSVELTVPDGVDPKDVAQVFAAQMGAKVTGIERV